MFEFMDGMMPRRRSNKMGTVTSMLLGATVGIAAWEVVRRKTNVDKIGDMDVEKMADSMMKSMDME